jgi:hypothetical protein
MGPGAPGPISRSPRLEDLVSLCRALNEAGARTMLLTKGSDRPKDRQDALFLRCKRADRL